MVTMKNTQQKEMTMWWRKSFLEVSEIALKSFKKTHDKTYYDYAIYFKEEADKKNREYQGLLQ